jgi:phosphoribosylformimino-5-aminoimidazole carboxamide ribotide isomerase
MIVIPAIDLMDGCAVRLEKGDFGTRTVYSNDPVDVASRFGEAGATRIHVVDLDGARTGRPVNEAAIRSIVTAGVEIEVGGGLRTIVDIERVLGWGAHAVVLGTAAVERLDLVRDACAKYPGRVRAGIDARDGEVKVSGWVDGTGLRAVDVARRVREAGVELVEYTDVSRDGMFTGVDAEGAARLQKEAGLPVVASGGVAALADVEACRKAGVAGVIIGKAIYEKRMDLAEAIRVAGSEPARTGGG